MKQLVCEQMGLIDWAFVKAMFQTVCSLLVLSILLVLHPTLPWAVDYIILLLLPVATVKPVEHSI